MLSSWSEKADHVELLYDDKTVVNVLKNDFNRAFGAIINASKEVALRSFGI